MNFTRESHYFDNSMLSAYKECPRKYFLRHVLGWTVAYDKEAPALVFGSSWHAGLDNLWALGPDASLSMRVEVARDGFNEEWTSRGYPMQEEMDSDTAEGLAPRLPSIAGEMYYHYASQREGMLNEAEVLAIEKPLAIPFPLLDDTFYVGKLDKVVEWNGVHILEHKTTSMYSIKSNFQPLYVESWGAASQLKGYQLAAEAYFPNMQDVWVDAALVHKKIHDAFKFIPISHYKPTLVEWVQHTAKWITEIQKELATFGTSPELPAGTFRKNEDACYGKYGVCPFLAICQTGETPSEDNIPMGYMEHRWEPFDLLKLDQLIHKEGGKE